MEKRTTQVNSVRDIFSEVYNKVNFWNIGFFIIISLITGLAVINAIFPDVAVNFNVNGLIIILPGDYFYELIFNPLWVVAAFFYERNIHFRLSENEIKIGKISSLTLDAANQKNESVLIRTLNDILSNKNQKAWEVQDIIDENKAEQAINEVDSINEEAPTNLNA